MKIKTKQKEILSDLYTPVSLFLKLRDKYANVLLLESSEYANKEGSYSFIVFDELASLEVKDFMVKIKYHHLPIKHTALNEILTEINNFLYSIDILNQEPNNEINGIFGYTTFEAIKYFEANTYKEKKSAYQIPDIKYGFYRFILVFDHFKNVLTIHENIPEGQEEQIENIQNIIEKQDHALYDYTTFENEDTNMSDEDFMNMVTRCKQECQKGNVFQIVPSRRYSYSFFGDEFNVYRKLRSINPSPYLFYFDYGSYKIFGSSPEAQIIVKDNEAEVHPIAGTIKRSMDIKKDNENTHKLLNDPKENAEHIMLVDLARNDLSRSTIKVHVSSYKEVQYFSHVIHLVSKVKGILKPGISAYQVFADTFPQGTLSGAPKIKALEIIEEIE
ncbi:MAG: hypothetical protein RLZZ546_934, partial [Bacteroidota bacterium]